MGNVLIVKNNGVEKDIYTYALRSYKEQNSYYYLASRENEDNLIEIKAQYKNDGLIMLVTYEDTEKKEVQNVFIGDNVTIEGTNKIFYNMRVYLTKEFHSRAIESILEKIDLDLDGDYGYKRYVIMSDMESLYTELRERINARNAVIVNNAKVCLLRVGDVSQPRDLAQKDEQSYRVYPSDKVSENRSEFQRDRERVVNCKAFRRLVDKAQIFGSSKGDYFRTRMTHSLEVNQIAKAIAYALNLNLDLTEAIALGHDIGHTPFGHQGERTLDDILSGEIEVGIVAGGLLKERCFGGFKHNYQSARILAKLEEKYIDHPGLNVSTQVVEGVLKHTKLDKDIKLEDFLNEKYIEQLHLNLIEGKYVDEQVCSTLEGQVVYIADEIAQRGHDVDDALTSGVMSIQEFLDRLKIIKCQDLHQRINCELDEINNCTRIPNDIKELKIARIVSCIVDYFINSTIQNSYNDISNWIVDSNNISIEEQLANNRLIDFSKEAKDVNKYLERVVQKKVICNCEVACADYNASMIVKTLFHKYYSNPRLLHEGTIHKVFVETLTHNNVLVANSAVNLSDASLKVANSEIEQITKKEFDIDSIRLYLQDGITEGREDDIIIFEKRKILVRSITDYIAGMTDGYALEEYERLK